eukprot:GAFH01001225.1.p7 GENE.GAFH01001225.1~~GAFH01001225.1.p7  ORF type:complete len:94 (+),score=41.49 GAFH01001225.1:1182-1463(+)
MVAASGLQGDEAPSVFEVAEPTFPQDLPSQPEIQKSLVDLVAQFHTVMAPVLERIAATGVFAQLPAAAPASADPAVTEPPTFDNATANLSELD